MNVHYTGKQGVLTPQQQRKLDAKYAKLGRLLDRSGGSDKEVHVILTTERHLNHAEVSIKLGGHALVGLASDAEQFAALTTAVDKLEKQVLKLRTKWRDTKRTPTRAFEEEEEAAEPVGPLAGEVEVESGEQVKVFRVDHHARRKPMTMEEALLAMGGERDYFVYRDAETDRLAVLLHRRDGHLDLIEA